MATAPHHRDRTANTRGTLAMVLLVAVFGAAVTGATLSLLEGLSLRPTPMLTTLDVALVLVAAGGLAVAYFLPVAIVLALS